MINSDYGTKYFSMSEDIKRKRRELSEKVYSEFKKFLDENADKKMAWISYKFGDADYFTGGVKVGDTYYVVEPSLENKNEGISADITNQDPSKVGKARRSGTKLEDILNPEGFFYSWNGPWNGGSAGYYFTNSKGERHGDLMNSLKDQEVTIKEFGVRS